MVWLVLWCCSGAIVGWAIGLVTGRPGLGVFLGMFCGVFGWLMLLGADPRAPSQLDSSAIVEARDAHSSEMGAGAAGSPSPIRSIAPTT
jgi:hypothetical protein